MTSRDFCYWLQGFFEIADPAALTPEQLDCVKKHEIDPSMGGPAKQEALNAIHTTPLKPRPKPPGIRC